MVDDSICSHRPRTRAGETHYSQTWPTTQSVIQTVDDGEIPSNVILLDQFIDVGIDGFSIGTNDLTMLILGVDRDNEHVASEYDERNPAVLWALEQICTKAKARGVTVPGVWAGPFNISGNCRETGGMVQPLCLFRRMSLIEHARWCTKQRNVLYQKSQVRNQC